MTLQELVNHWEGESHGNPTKDMFTVKLDEDDAAKIDALAEMYPKRTKEQIVSELVTAALAELETNFPYIQGSKIVSRDEWGNPVYNDAGPTPTFLALSKKYLQLRKQKT